MSVIASVPYKAVASLLSELEKISERWGLNGML